MQIRSLLALLGLASLSFGPAGCGGSPASDGAAPAGGTSSSDTRLKGMVQADGSSTVFQITEAVAEEFRSVQPDIKVTVGVSGTGGGFKKFTSGEIDIADASRPISTEEIQAAASNGVEFIELPVAYDALTVVVHPANTWAQTMTVDELKRIWEPAATGKITKWSQVRPGWPDRKLKLYGPGSDSGTFDYFTKAIVGEEKSSRGDYTASEDDNVLVQGVARDPDALGYFGFAYYMENREKLKAVSIDDGISTNGEGPQAPSVEGVEGGTYQPLSRPIFIYVTKTAAQRPEVAAFVEYYLAQTATLAAEVGYVALRPEVSALVEARYRAGTTGSLFGGKAAVGVRLGEILGKESGESAAP